MNQIYFLLIITLMFITSTSDFKPDSFLKGMTVSCQTWGAEWATPEMKATMNELRDLGVNSIAIHPYARISEDGRVQFRRDVTFHIATPIQWAKELGQKFMIKPHLAYWGTQFGWRGDINFQNDDEWNQFFSTYKVWLVEIAQLAEECDADILCVGTEYRHSLRYSREWREVIDAVRQVYHGKLTYAANWDTYNNVTFWDALDYIGIQAYFPLVDSASPSEAALTKAWHSVYKKIIPFAEKNNKKIIFTEIGYNTSENAARIPWTPKSSQTETALAVQEKCLKVAIKLNTNHKSIAGIFLWKWFPETQPFEHYENFNLQRPEIKKLISDLWKN